MGTWNFEIDEKTSIEEYSQKSITGKFTRLGQQIFPGVVFEIIFHPWIFIITV